MNMRVRSAGKQRQGYGIQVIGAGFGRTGTLSVKSALEKLGMRCYHMEEVLRLKHFKRWHDYATGTAPMDWDALFADFEATVDFPASLHYRALMKKYPHAKVLLTVREPESWWKSFSATLLTAYAATTRASWLKLFPQMRLINRFQDSSVFKVFGPLPISKETAIQAFKRHIEEVRATVPPDRLLEFDVREGWEPLCRFLERPVPDEPFPHLNDTAEFRKRIRLTIAADRAIGFAAISLTAVLIWFVVRGIGF